VEPDLASVFLRHLAYCRENGWAGYEPYDALNSKLLTALPFLDSRLPRLAATQALKRVPINFRPLLLIRKTQNPKALAIFLSALLRAPEGVIGGREGLVDQLIDRLIALRSPQTPRWCWGYSFPWQTRTVLVPRWAPNLVCTSFAASALLDVYERQGDPRCLNMAVSAAEYLLNDLYWCGAGSVAGFDYPLPSVRNQVHNANFLASDLLCRVYRHTNEKRFLTPALQAARYSATQQQADGSWYYGEAASQRWIDNFHTGFNLCALHSIGRNAATQEFASYIRRGLTFYRDHFFRRDGSVRYFHDRTYPIDTHCIAQGIITLLQLRDLNPANVPLAKAVYRWAVDHMWDERGYFYFRRLRFFTVRTSYMRWTQAWMSLALATLLAESAAEVKPATKYAAAGVH
jgi:hypothetical protein